MRSVILPIVLLGLSACGTQVDTGALPSTDGYTQWLMIETSGPVPGHGDTVRKIYVNETGRDYRGTGRYPLNTVIVKEILSDATSTTPTYLGIMRKLNDSDAPDGATLQDGWLFTIADALPGDEINDLSCWDACHRQAPADGAWFDYGR